MRRSQPTTRISRGPKQSKPTGRAPWETRCRQRQGSTLLVVIALLAMLALLGVVFYTFAAQERSNAEYFADSAKVRACGIPASVYFDFGLRQIINGPNKDEVQSALWGGRDSLVINMLGYDPNQEWDPESGTISADELSKPFRPEAHPFTGQGIHLRMDATGNVTVDQDYDGTADGTPILLNANLSMSALWNEGTTMFDKVNPLSLPQPDVDYTSPDRNHLFISYDGYGINNVGAPQRVIIPSFLRPQNLRGTADANWWNSATTASRTLRPHPDHVNVNATLNAGSRKFLYVQTQAEANTLGFANGPFPFNGADTDSSDSIDDGSLQFGVFQSGGGNVKLDVDNTQDGINDGIWMYLGFPIQHCPDGSSFVAMHSVTIVDLDSLLNNNMHGNSSTIDDLPLINGNRYQLGGRFISQSAQGLDPGEVNLQQALYALPPSTSGETSMIPYSQFYGREPADYDSAAMETPPTPAELRTELSNMESIFLTRGRPEFGSGDAIRSNVTDIFPGRYGEAETVLFDAIREAINDAMDAGNFPKPGVSFVNDQPATDPATESPRFGHPLAYNGRGSYTFDPLSSGNNNDYKIPALLQAFGSGSGNPSVWLQYDNYQLKGWVAWLVGADGRPGRAGIDDDLDGVIDFETDGSPDLSELGWANTDDPPANLVTSYFRNAHLDDAMEITVDRENLQSSDATFSAGESALLQMSQTALDTVSLFPRMENLLPFTFGTSADARRVSKLFTSLSVDRKSFGFARTETSTGTRTRDWEFNADIDNDTKLEFPPQFVSVAANDLREPFRAAVRQLMETEDGRTPTEGLTQYKLSITRLLDYDNAGALRYRALTPHPVNPGTGIITFFTDTTVLDPLNPASIQEQEFWARYDRQRMARDIYVLLYTLGGGNDDRDYTTTNDHSGTMTPLVTGDHLYTRDQLREMAQLAVNIVDALDRDNVITKFEYDKNLGPTIQTLAGIATTIRTGWNLDDNPFDNDGFGALSSTDVGYDLGYPEDSIERGVVYGVEAQQLTFSEILAVYAQKFTKGAVVKVPTNHGATQWNDEADTFFAYVELRNASPFQVNFNNGDPNTSTDNGAWQIEVEVVTALGVSTTRYLTIKRDSVAAGGLFSISSIGGSEIVNRYRDVVTPMVDQPARMMYANEYLDGMLATQVYDDRIAPHTLGTGLDLIKPAPPLPTNTSRYELRDGGGSVTETVSGRQYVSLLDDLNVGTPVLPGTTVNFRLRRRLHPGRGTPFNSFNSVANYDNDNPWIVVDETKVEFSSGNAAFRQLTISEANDVNGVDLVGNFNGLRSLERDQALDRSQESAHVSGAVTFRRNTVGAKNTTSDTAFTLWQPHFDRDFSSIGELLSLPLYGPEAVTELTRRNSLNPGMQASIGPAIAAARFLQPKSPLNAGLPIPADPLLPLPPAEADLDLDNRWYRLLEFVEVPTRTHLQLPLLDPGVNSALDVPLVPGKPNLNMMRHSEVLAALLDDPQVAGDGNAYMLSPAYMNNPTTSTSHMPDRLEGNERDWWEQFLYVRDQRDPVTGLYLPGLPGSRPFRSFAFSPPLRASSGSYRVEGIDDTLLRGLGVPSGTVSEAQRTDGRRLFELASEAGADPDFKAKGIDQNRYRNTNARSRPIEPLIRHRLLSKIIGNTTTRSHAFVVFVSVGFFEAKETATGGLRIGGRLDGQASDTVDHRGVFVVNRALIDKAYNPTTGLVDWEKLVEYRLTVK